MSGGHRAERLDNGALVATEPMAGVKTAAIGVWVAAGARHEPVEWSGVSHFLEHMAFKGTERRTARQIAEAIEDVGGHLNAYTSREQTAYYVRVMAKDAPLALDLLGDIVLHSRIDREELERERQVILQEIGQVIDTPDDWVFDLFQEAAFPDQPLGRSILGTAEGIRAMPAEALEAQMARHHRGSALTIAAAGAIEHEAVVGLAERHFGAAAACEANAVEPARYRGGAIERCKDLEQAHLVFGVEAFGYHDPDFYALQALSTLLGGGMSSRLFQQIREERGLAYSVFSFATNYADAGLFGVYAGVDAEELDDVAALATEILRSAMRLDDEAELARARNQLAAGTLMALESCSAVAEDVARHHQCFGRRTPVDEVIAKIEAVDLDAVRRVAERLFRRSDPTIAVIGPVDAAPSRSEIAASLGG